MPSERRGVPGTEAAVVIVVIAIFMVIAVPSLGPTAGEHTVYSAREALAAMHARTRAHAISTGQVTVLNLDFHQDRAWISQETTTLETLQLDEVMGVDLQADTDMMRICMNAKGFGDVSCNSFDRGTDILFVRGKESERMRLYPLGQIVLP